MCLQTFVSQHDEVLESPFNPTGPLAEGLAVIECMK